MEAAAVHRDWSGLPEDLMEMVMRVLSIADLLRAAAICTSWRAAFSAVRRVRIPIKDASPCLLYSCAGDDAHTATLYSPSAGAAFKVRLPGEHAFRSLYVVGSDHGWIVAADEESNLHLVNPLRGAQEDLPPVTGLHHVESTSDDQGRPMYNLYGEYPYPEIPCVHKPERLRLFLYERAYLSCSPSAGAACIVLLLHRPEGQLSFARPGADGWTHITDSESVERASSFRCAAYNDKDGLFYLISGECSVYTLDLNGPSPVMKEIVWAAELWDHPIKSIVFTPWGDILLVWKFLDLRYKQRQVPAELAHGASSPLQEMYTVEIELFNVNVDDDQKLVKITSEGLRDHALFLGFNSTILISAKHLSALKPNCAYITDDCSENICINMYGRREEGIWNFETETLESLGNMHTDHPWLNWPPPIWITPSLT